MALSNYQVKTHNYPTLKRLGRHITFHNGKQDQVHQTNHHTLVYTTLNHVNTRGLQRFQD